MERLLSLKKNLIHYLHFLRKGGMLHQAEPYRDVLGQEAEAGARKKPRLKYLL